MSLSAVFGCSGRGQQADGISIDGAGNRDGDILVCKSHVRDGLRSKTTETTMNWHAMRGPLKHLGRLHGTGDLLIRNGERNLGTVTYEIDGYARREMRSDNGQIEGAADMLARAFRAGGASIVLADGQSIDIELSDPQGGSMADVVVKGRFPQFDRSA